MSCSEPFETENIRKKRCKPHCGEVDNRDRSGRARGSEKREQARAAAKAEHAVEFIGVDGEGQNVEVWATEYDENGDEITVRRKIHQYVVLGVGDAVLHRDGQELGYQEIFSFLWEQFEAHPNAAFVGFFLGYDFTHWLKGLPVHAAASLLTKAGVAARQREGNIPPWPVRDGSWERVGDRWTLVGSKWEFDILGYKRFKLRPYVAPDKVPTRIVTRADGTQVVEKIPRPWMYVCDAGPFFQTSFLKAIDPKNWTEPICTPSEFEILKRGKDSRAGATFGPEMIRYNALENEILARVMDRLNAGFVSDGIRLSKAQWFGPGQAAQEWMKLIGAPTGEQIRENVPEPAREAARKTYYGGWFEVFNHGPVPGTSYCYDIVSAYPAEIAKLPCLLHAKWRSGYGKPRTPLPAGAYQMALIDYEGTDEWAGPFPWRDADGSIARPQMGKGWYWQHEIDAAVRAGLAKKVVIREWWRFQPQCDCPPPYAPIVELFQGRLRVGKKTPEGMSKKYIYNSAYGKNAQSVGEPKFANPIYASLITAGCRVRILDAIATHPTKTASLLMVATDGVVFKQRHPGLDIDPDRLGAWEEEEYENLSLFKPGVYWHDRNREEVAAGKDPKLKSRGISAKVLGAMIERVDTMWRTTPFGPDWKAPEIELTVPWAQVSAKQAINRNQWQTAGMALWNEVRRESAAIESKRWTISGDDSTSWGGIRSRPYYGFEAIESTYYTGTFGEQVRAQAEAENEVTLLETPEGTVGEVQAWAIR